MSAATESRELLRVAILKVLEATPKKYGLGATALGHLVVTYGFTPSVDELEIQLRYLDSKKMIEPVNRDLSPENYAWQITGTGSDYVAMHG